MDRLSGLPDELIFHILSFLVDPKILVRTSILSKAWRFHWSRVPGFGFTKLIDQNQTQTPIPIFSKYRWWRFPFFGLRKQQIMDPNPNPNTNNIFHIGPATSNHEFESWIAACNIRNLVVNAVNYHLPLPPCIFTSSETLLSLCIIDSRDIPKDATLYFPALKNLQLVNVSFDSENSVSYLLERCPVLEELTFERMSCFVFSDSNTLTKLAINIKNSNLVMIRIPALRYLRLHVRMSIIRYIYAWKLPLLIKADIDLMNIEAGYTFSQSVIDFVGKMYNVSCLTLSTRPMKISTSYFSELDGVKFHNLTELNLRTDWRFITLFLENANNLRVLKISHVGTKYWMEPKQVPACMVSLLNIVNLVDFWWCTEIEFDMLKYILKNATVLKKMEIVYTPHCQLDWNVKFEEIKRFAALEIGPMTCDLTLTSL